MPLGFGSLIYKVNVASARKSEISRETAVEMVETFEPDIELLSKITQRDLSHWISYGRQLLNNG